MISLKSNKEKELLVIPAYNHNYYWRNEGGQAYNGAMVFKITKENIELKEKGDKRQETGDRRQNI